MENILLICDVRDMSGCVVDMIEIKDVKCKSEGILRKYSVVWKDTKEGVTKRMLERLLSGDYDLSLRKDGTTWSSSDLCMVDTYMLNRDKLEVDYEYLASRLYRSVSGVETRVSGMYTGVRGWEDACRFDLSVETVCCEECGCDHIIKNEWQGKIICNKCKYTVEKKGYMDNLWSSLGVCYKCVCCEVEVDRYDMNFDHKNVFYKGESICTLVRRGESLDVINEEISKCQVLCKECHEWMTHLEKRFKLTNIKRTISRDEWEKYAKITEDFQGRILAYVKSIKCVC
jgi:hypothetical protein